MGISVDFFKIDKRKWGKTKPLPFRKDYPNRDKFELALEDFHNALYSKCSILNEITGKNAKRFQRLTWKK